MTNTKKYNELVEKIKELEYWQEIERRRADLDAGNGKVLILEQAIKYAEEKAKAKGIKL
ncbi:axf protein [Fusobacterium polymorphum]|uniref:axf protein n=1 Tax=Fusobacterium nucleatum subsp. polymorphum TaxID=76857 RepID=UPI000BFE5F5C|nr:axf protein [Fusobacterium polymorphum]PHI09101.1 axf protein [Fusobacterium polymorphum]